MVDKIKPLKIENPTDGTEDDLGFPTEADPSEDYVHSKGLAVTDNHLVHTVDNEVAFQDPINGQKKVSELLTTFENLDGNSDVGTGSDQVAVGNHTHSNSDVNVKVSSNDTTTGFLNGKIVQGTGIVLTEQNDGGNETLEISSTTSGGDPGGTLTFGDKSESGLPSGPLKVTGGSYLGYMMPSAKSVKAIGIITDFSNSNNYILKKNGSTIQSVDFTTQLSKTVDGLSLAYVKDDILTAEMVASNITTDINNAYTPDANALFLAHIDGDDKNLRHVTNSSTIAKGMSGRLISGANFTTSGPFDRCVNFDGNDDYIEILHHNDYNIQNCTVELFFKLDVNNRDQCLFSKNILGNGLYIGAYNDHVYIDLEGIIIDVDENLAADTWYHIAIVMGTGGLKVFLEGSSVGNNATTQGLDDNVKPITLGASNTGSDYYNNVAYKLNGKIAELRISDTRRYETNFTKPSAAFTNDANTLGLWHLNEDSGVLAYDSSDIIHNASMMATGSICEPKTDKKKFGTHAIKMNGSKNDWLRFNHIPDYEASTITVESWVLPHKDSRDGIIFQKGTSCTEGGLRIKWRKGCRSRERYIEVTYWGNSTNRILATNHRSFSKDQWHHIAVVLHADYIKIFVDGIQQNAASLTADYANVWTNNKEDVYWGASNNRNDYAKVYLDEMRISDVIRSYGDNASGVTEVSMIVEVE